ncbi:hypothetical protein EAH89_29625 [Roseomonas nepalensis]|uniref:Uncharacterized protein n=1 Tax=Muricoccus nepalensis TaxID=1854500 RepID=A0A502ENH2_9PROT|nr:hypothetical protein EAH89_29625 [Roseomonas nepalensis]
MLTLKVLCRLPLQNAQSMVGHWAPRMEALEASE